MKVSVSANSQHLAQVWTADFGKFLSEFATQSEAPPKQLAWCGTDSVVLYWEVRASLLPLQCAPAPQPPWASELAAFELQASLWFMCQLLL